MQHPFKERESKFKSVGQGIFAVSMMLLFCCAALFVQNALKPYPDMALQYLFWYAGGLAMVTGFMGGLMAMFGCLIQAIWSLDRGDA